MLSLFFFKGYNSTLDWFLYFLNYYKIYFYKNVELGQTYYIFVLLKEEYIILFTN